MLALTLIAAAPADPMIASYEIADAACDPAYLTDTLPAPDQASVPLDTALTMVLAGDCGETLFSVSLVEAQSGNVVLAEEVSSEAGWLSLTPQEPLTAETAYRFIIEPLNGWGSIVEVDFETGTELAVGMAAGLPELTINQADIYQEDRHWYASDLKLTITPLPDPDALSLVSLYSVENAVYTEGFYALDSDQSFPVYQSWSSTEEPAEVCFEAIQHDIRGGVASSGVICQDTNIIGWKPWGGCSTAGGAAGLLALIPGLLAVFRRRR